jgi:hypothetical protein
MTKRLFTFGCSFTSYVYPTWADIISVNFDEYYNFGRSGCSNTYIMNKVVMADELIEFNCDTDTVIVLLTGFGRFSYLPRQSVWHTYGDLYNYNRICKNPTTIGFYNNMWSDNWAVHDSWIAATVIKKILTANRISHKIFMATENDYYLSSFADLDPLMLVRAKEVYDKIDNPLSLESWRKSNFNDSGYRWKDINNCDDHPNIDVYLQYAKHFFPQFLSTKSEKFAEFWKYNFDFTSKLHMEQKFNNLFRNQFDKAFINNELF